MQTAASGLGPGVSESVCKPFNSCFSVCSPLGLWKQAPLVLKTDAWRACLSEAGVKSWELGVGYEPFSPRGEPLGLRSFLPVGGWAGGEVYGKTAPVHPAGLTVGLRFCADADELLSGCAGPFRGRARRRRGGFAWARARLLPCTARRASGAGPTLPWVSS